MIIQGSVMQADLDQKRAKALRHYNSEINRIDQVAGAARTKAKERQRNEELKTRAKANKIRETGEVPTTCFCC